MPKSTKRKPRKIEKMPVTFRVWPNGKPTIVAKHGKRTIPVQSLDEARQLAAQHGYDGIRVSAI